MYVGASISSLTNFTIPQRMDIAKWNLESDIYYQIPVDTAKNNADDLTWYDVISNRWRHVDGVRPKSDVHAALTRVVIQNEVTNNSKSLLGILWNFAISLMEHLVILLLKPIYFGRDVCRYACIYRRHDILTGKIVDFSNFRDVFKFHSLRCAD